MPAGFGGQHASMHHSAQPILFAKSKDMHFGEMAHLNCPFIEFFPPSMSVFECFTGLELATHPGCTISHIKGTVAGISQRLF